MRIVKTNREYDKLLDLICPDCGKPYNTDDDHDINYYNTQKRVIFCKCLNCQETIHKDNENSICKICKCSCCWVCFYDHIMKDHNLTTDQYMEKYERMVLKHSPQAEVYTNDGIQIDTQEFPYSDTKTELEKENDKGEIK